MNTPWLDAPFSEFLKPNTRPYTLGPEEDANLVGMRWYGEGPFHRELKSAIKIAKKTHFVIKAGDIMYNKLFAWKGSFGLVPPALDGMFVSDKFPTYELDRSKVDENWLRWFFRWPPLWEQARTMSTGSAAVSKLTLNPPKFLQLKMPLPRLDEQRELAARLDGLAVKTEEARSLQGQALIECANLLKTALRRIAAKVNATGQLSQVLTGKPRNGWSAKCDNAEGGIPVLSLGAVTGFRYRATEFKKTSLHADKDGHFWLQPGDLLITRSNTPELVGHAAIYNGRPSPCIYPDLMMRLPLNLDEVDPTFVWYWLQSPPARDFIFEKAKGTSSTMKKISQGVVMAIPFPTHLGLPEQRRIVDELDRLQSKADSVKALQAETGTELRALMPSIVSGVFTGQLA
jgi:type I restriction enzyme, S subunit